MKLAILLLNAESHTKLVELVYSNTTTIYNFLSNMDDEKIKSEFKDDFITDSGFSMSFATGSLKNKDEIFRIQFDIDYLQKLYKKNRSKIKNEIKIPKEYKN